MSLTTPPPAPTDRILRAILAILFSVSCFSVLNAISKTLTQHYPVAEVVWARYFVAFEYRGFDSDPDKISWELEGVPVYDVADLARVTREKKLEIIPAW